MTTKPNAQDTHLPKTKPSFNFVRLEDPEPQVIFYTATKGKGEIPYRLHFSNVEQFGFKVGATVDLYFDLKALYIGIKLSEMGNTTIRKHSVGRQFMISAQPFITTFGIDVPPKSRFPLSFDEDSGCVVFGPVPVRADSQTFTGRKEYAKRMVVTCDERRK